MDIGITVDTREIEAALRKAPDEFKRAIRNALNDTARDVQKAERLGLKGKFDLRRKTFNEQRVYIGAEDKASKTKLESAVRIQPKGGSLLGKYEEGEDRTPRTSSTMPVPMPGIIDKGGHVKRGYGFKALGPFVDSGPTSRLKRVKGKLVAAGRGSTRTQKTGKRGTFISTLRKSGLSAVLQRVPGTRALRVLFLFLPKVDLPDALKFVDTARAAAPKAWTRRATEAIHHALRRAGLT